MSGLWLAIGVTAGGAAMIVLVEWLVLRNDDRPTHDDGTADRSDEP